MADRHLPVRPNLDQLKRQAKELLASVRKGDAEAVAEFAEHHPNPPDPTAARLADAQLALARAYSAPAWPRLVQACRLVNAIWEDDLDTVRRLVRRHPNLLRESALVRESNWGPPMSYAANLGRDRIIEWLQREGADDFAKALDRAMLQGRVETARKLHAAMGRPALPQDILSGPAYTINAAGTALAIELGAPVVSRSGRRIAPVWVVLESDSRKPAEKHAILEMYAEHGLDLPDTPTMALHRGRIDLLEKHLAADPDLLTRTFGHWEIYPPEMGCRSEETATQGTPLKGGTLLHLAVDYDEFEIAEWLLAKGMPVDARAAVDGDGFGGHTALFGAVLSPIDYLRNLYGRDPSPRFAELLLAHGADPNARASLQKELHPGYEMPGLHEYRDVTPLSWGRRFHVQTFVNGPALRVIEVAGGVM